jgi:3-hydroxy-9,10-secoandrosta-1,3,5(10)-triene-9,17-dione monooxygenase
LPHKPGAGLRTENTAEGQKALRAELMARASALVPLLRAKAAENERERRISKEILAAIDAAGLFRMRAPKRFGGFEADLRTYMDVVTELGRGCGSTSWIAFISIATAWIAALFGDEAQREVFEGNPDARFMGALSMTSRASATQGGYVVDGKWAYASNCLHAHWAVLAVPLPNDGAAVPGIALMPMRELTIEDTWHVVGMRGTGSQTVHAREVFVPAHRTLAVAVLARGQSPRTNSEELVYRESFLPTAIIAVAAPVLGLAQAAMDFTLERLNKSSKPIAYSFYDDARNAPSIQLELAQASTLIETAILHMRRWCDDIAEAARAGEELPFIKRAQIRMDIGSRCAAAVRRSACC